MRSNPKNREDKYCYMKNCYSEQKKYAYSFRIGLIFMRFVIYFIAMWLLIELSHYFITGHYILYYKIVLLKAQSFPEQMSIVHDVYNIQQNAFTIVFSNRIVPYSTLLSLLVMSIDTISFFYKDKKTIWYLFDLLSLIILVCVGFVIF